MKTRGMIFTGDSIPAIAEGRKTVTRRVVKYISALGEAEDWCHKADGAQFAELVGDYRRFCPYGVPGDRLYVKECIKYIGVYPDNGQVQFKYRMGGCSHADNVPKWPNYLAKAEKGQWISPRFMPHWASRFTLEIVDVRPERLQEITEADAQLEGFERREHFIRYWDSLHKKPEEQFDADPWVWRIEFRKADGSRQ